MFFHARVRGDFAPGFNPGGVVTIKMGFSP